MGCRVTRILQIARGPFPASVEDPRKPRAVLELITTKDHSDTYRPMLARSHGIANVGNPKRLRQLSKILGIKIRSPYHLLTVPQVSELTGMPRALIKLLVFSGRLGFVQPRGPGGHIYIPVAALEHAMIFWSCGNITYDLSLMVSASEIREDLSTKLEKIRDVDPSTV